MPKVEIGTVVMPRWRTVAESASVEEMAADIAANGQVSPIEVSERMMLIDGCRRLYALRSLNLPTIDITVIPEADMAAEIAKIDTAVRSNQLNALERSLHLRRRKDLYDALYPPGRGIRSNNEDVKERTGVANSVVNRAIVIARGLSEETVAVIRGSALENTLEHLHRLATTPHREQLAMIKQILRELGQPMGPQIGPPRPAAPVGRTRRAKAERERLQEVIQLTARARNAFNSLCHDLEAKHRADMAFVIAKKGDVEDALNVGIQELRALVNQCQADP